MGEALAASTVLRTLADLYAAAKAGRTGQGERDFQVDFRDLLRRASAEDGDARAQALSDLLLVEARGIIGLDRHRRDRDIIEKARLPVGNEALLFALLGEPPPTKRRAELARQFAVASQEGVPQRWLQHWAGYLSRLEQDAVRGDSIAPFSRVDLKLNEELLGLLPRLLKWEGESLIRFASCVLCGDSKRLGELSNKITRILADFSSGEVSSLEMLGILETPRTALLHGPVQFRWHGQCVDLGVLAGPVRLSEEDIAGAEHVDVAADRCLTVENETTFHELAKLNTGVLLVCTSFPGAGTRALLQRLPSGMDFWHFGDADAAGFEILRDLRERTGKAFKSLHMNFRDDPSSPLLTAEERRSLLRLVKCPSMHVEANSVSAMLAAGRKGRFEQESLGRPTMPWPFYR